MKKGYQSNELWTAVSRTTGKPEFVDPEGEFIAGETIVSCITASDSTAT